MSIPAMLHFYWNAPSGDNSPPPSDVQKNVSAWIDLHPSFQYKVWTLQELHSLLKHFHGLKVLEAIEACRFEAMKSDIVRLVVVYEYGGFYSDLKNFPLKAFLDQLINENVAVITEHPPTIPLEDFTGHYSNAFLAGPPKHPLFLEILTAVCEKIARREQGGVTDITGLGVLKKVIQRQNYKPQGGSFKCLSSQDAWGLRGVDGGLMKRTPASYNGFEMRSHWSTLQKCGGIYTSSA